MARTAAMKKVLSPISVTRIIIREFTVADTKLVVPAIKELCIPGTTLSTTAAVAIWNENKPKRERDGQRLTADRTAWPMSNLEGNKFRPQRTAVLTTIGFWPYLWKCYQQNRRLPKHNMQERRILEINKYFWRKTLIKLKCRYINFFKQPIWIWLQETGTLHSLDCFCFVFSRICTGVYLLRVLL